MRLTLTRSNLLFKEFSQNSITSKKTTTKGKIYLFTLFLFQYYCSSKDFNKSYFPVETMDIQYNRLHYQLL